jgi:hypothetical protein
MDRVLAQAFAVLLEFDLGRSAGDLDFGAVVQVTGFGALKPRHFSILFCHDNFQKPKKAQGASTLGF